MSVIRTVNIYKTFGEGETEVHALNDVTLNVEPGEFLAIVGPSGSGKSTLLNIMGGLDHPTKGDVEIAGKKISSMTGKELSEYRRDHIGLIFQAYNLIPVLTVMENVEYVLLLQGVDKKERRNRVRQLLNRIGLEGKEDRFPAQLSGGQQQRVAVARAMVSRPDLILADEPTANLDSEMAINLLTLMRDLNQKEGMTFIFSTHDQKIMDRADRLITLKDGRVETDIRR